MNPLLLCLLAALVLQGSAAVGRACQYCRMAAEDPEMARLAAAMHAKSGGFPLDGAVSRFQAAAAPAALTTAPSAASVATSTADLPAALPRRVLPPAAATTKPVVASSAATSAVSSPAPAKDTANRWANGGLLGLLGLAGVFGWRTRARRTGRSAL